MRDLDLALIGNGRLGLLIDARGTVVWGCYPRFDGDPMFCALLDTASDDEARGIFSITLDDWQNDDFGAPENAFVVCTFWLVDALAQTGRHEEARMLFERLLASRNRHGLLAEHVNPQTGEHWGNFVQTYGMVGLITSAIRLSIPWDEAF